MVIYKWSEGVYGIAIIKICKIFKNLYKTYIPNFFMIKYILLDVHGVITNGMERKRFLRFMHKRYKMNYKEHNKLWAEHLKKLDVGKEKATEYLNEINKKFGKNFSVNEYYSIFLKQITPNKAFLRSFNKINGIKICIISDTLPPITSGLKRIFGSGFKNYRKYYSYKIGKTKSDARFFNHVLKDLRTPAKDCIFIDDNKGNVEIAKDIGINAILFRNARQASDNVLAKIKQNNIALA